MLYIHTWGEVCRNESVYYVNLNEEDWLYYYDAGSGQSGKLCGKPECMHDDNSCNAYIEMSGGIQIYDQHLYWVSGTVLYRCALDGTNREIVQTIPGIINPFFVIHRGYIYCAYMDNVIVDAEDYTEVSLVRYKLEEDSDGQVLFEERYSNVVLPPRCVFDGDDMYWLVELDQVGDYREFERLLLRYDLASGESSAIIHESSPWSTKSLTVNKDGLLMMELKRTDAEDYRFIVKRNEYDWNGQLRKNGEDILLPEDFVGATALENYTVLYTGYKWSQESQWKYQVFALNDELIREGTMEGKMPGCVGEDTNGLIFVQFYWDEEDGRFYKLVNVPLDAEKKDKVWIEYGRT